MPRGFVRCVVSEVTNHLKSGHFDTAQKHQENQRQDNRHLYGDSTAFRSVSGS
jgi:hypothetical protein